MRDQNKLLAKYADIYEKINTIYVVKSISLAKACYELNIATPMYYKICKLLNKKSIALLKNIIKDNSKKDIVKKEHYKEENIKAIEDIKIMKDMLDKHEEDIIKKEHYEEEIIKIIEDIIAMIDLLNKKLGINKTKRIINPLLNKNLNNLVFNKNIITIEYILDDCKEHICKKEHYKEQIENIKEIKDRLDNYEEYIYKNEHYKEDIYKNEYYKEVIETIKKMKDLLNKKLNINNSLLNKNNNLNNINDIDDDKYKNSDAKIKVFQKIINKKIISHQYYMKDQKKLIARYTDIYEKVNNIYIEKQISLSKACMLLDTTTTQYYRICKLLSKDSIVLSNGVKQDTPKKIDTKIAIKIVTKEPKLVKTKEPNLVITKEPKLVKTKEPNLVKTKEPNLVKTKEPNLVKTKEIKLVKTKKPKLVPPKKIYKGGETLDNGNFTRLIRQTGGNSSILPNKNIIELKELLDNDLNNDLNNNLNNNLKNNLNSINDTNDVKYQSGIGESDEIETYVRNGIKITDLRNIIDKLEC